MVKVNRVDSIVVSKESYPCLKIHEEDGRIVLFTGSNTGYELCSNNHPKGFLYCGEDWVESMFVLYHGTIELTNNL